MSVIKAGMAADSPQRDGNADSIDTLELLHQSSNDDLAPLVAYIVEKGGFTNGLSKSVDYQRHHPDHSRYVGAIHREIREYGSNSIAHLFRPAAAYEDIVRDVAKRFKVRDTKGSSLVATEERILRTILDEALKHASATEQEEIERALREAGVGARDLSALRSGAALAGTVAGRLVLYRTSTVIAQAVARQALGHGLRIAGNGVLMRGLGVLAGPVGWILTGAWTAVDLAGPAYRVTVPCVIHIAMLRQKHLHEQAAKGRSGDEKEVFVDE